MEKQVKDLMVPVSEYVTVSKDATLSEAFAALTSAAALSVSENEKAPKFHHRAILIYDENKKIVGKVSMLCILRALEPKYDQMLPEKSSIRMGFTRQFQKTMLEQLKLWEYPLDHICEKAADKKVESFMSTPTEGEYIEINASINEAVHQLVMGRHQSLLVLENKEIVGILRLTDVFVQISEVIAECKL